MKRAVIALCGLLGACSGTVVQDRPVRVNVPVVQPCALQRPATPELLRDRRDLNWSSLDVKQKAAAVAKQALDWMTYAEKLNAATAGCP